MPASHSLPSPASLGYRSMAPYNSPLHEIWPTGLNSRLASLALQKRWKKTVCIGITLHFLSVRMAIDSGNLSLQWRRTICTALQVIFHWSKNHGWMFHLYNITAPFYFFIFFYSSIVIKVWWLNYFMCQIILFQSWQLLEWVLACDWIWQF